MTKGQEPMKSSECESQPEVFMERVKHWASHGMLIPLFLLWASFLVFLDYHSYCLYCSETVIGFLGVTLLALGCSFIMKVKKGRLAPVVLVGLIVLVCDQQFNLQEDYLPVLLVSFGIVLLWVYLDKFYMVANWICGTMLLVTVLKMGFLSLWEVDRDVRFGPGWGRVKAAQSAPPRLIHLILDGHIGIERFTLDDTGKVQKDKLIKFFVENGFQLYGNAYSHDDATIPSIPFLMNLSDKSSEKLFTSIDSTHILLRNKYFQELAKRQYHINVLQSHYLDFCVNSPIPIANCIEYPSGSIAVYSNLPLPLSMKVQILLNYYFLPHGKSKVLDTFLSYTPIYRLVNKSRFFPRVAESIRGLETLREDIPSFPLGHALFGHLLVPHAPFQLKSDCEVFVPDSTTTRTRQNESDLYFQQLNCIYFRLTSLFDQMRDGGIFDQSIIILNGDHGPRQAVQKGLERPASQDSKNQHPTLFAVKMPDSQGRYDTSIRPITELLREVVQSIPPEVVGDQGYGILADR